MLAKATCDCREEGGDRTVGGLTARDLALPLEYYNEQEYYNDVRNLWWGLGQQVESTVDEPETVTPAD